MEGGDGVLEYLVVGELDAPTVRLGVVVQVVLIGAAAQ